MYLANDSNLIRNAGFAIFLAILNIFLFLIVKLIYNIIKVKRIEE
jgi:hypothetical protein